MMAILVALVVLVTGTTLAQAPAAADTTLMARLTPAVRGAVLPTLDSARRAQLPVGPLIDKALEGQAKLASPDRIAAVVRELAGLMGDARSTLGPETNAMDLAAGASALRAGVSPAVLAQLRSTRPRQPLAVPLGVMAELIARGVSPDTASAAIVALAREGASDADLVALRRQVDQDLAAGVAPSVSAAQRATDAASSLGANSPTSLISHPPPPPPPPRPARP